MILAGVENGTASTLQGAKERREVRAHSAILASNPSSVGVNHPVGVGGVVDGDVAVVAFAEEKGLEARQEASNARTAGMFGNVGNVATVEGGLDASMAKSTELVADDAKLDIDVDADKAASSELVAQNSDPEVDFEEFVPGTSQVLPRNATLNANAYPSLFMWGFSLPFRIFPVH